MGNLGWGEMMVIAIFALLLFGPKKLPEMGKSLGTAIQEFKKALNGTPEAKPEDKPVAKAAETTEPEKKA